MADDPGPGLRDALVAHLARLAPQLAGLRKWASISPITPEFKSALQTQIRIKQHRVDLVQLVLSDMDKTIGDLANLEQDGYPALPSAVVSEGIISEFVTDRNELLVAIAVFQPPDPVTVFFDPTVPSTARRQPVPRQS